MDGREAVRSESELWYRERSCPEWEAVKGRERERERKKKKERENMRVAFGCYCCSMSVGSCMFKDARARDALHLLLFSS